MPLGHRIILSESFLKKLHTGEALKIDKLHFAKKSLERGPAPERKLFPEITYLSESLICMARATFVHQKFALLTSPA